jgi:hypothetical protein
MWCFTEPLVVIHCELCWASGFESLWAMLSQWLWLIVSYAEPMVLNHCVLCWAIGFEPLWVMLSQWVWIMVCYAEPMIVKHLCWAHCAWIMVCFAVSVGVNQCELCWAGSVAIMVCYVKPVVVNHCVMLRRVCGSQGVLFWTSGWESRCECYVSGCELWWVVLSQWLWITMCYYVPVGVNHGELSWGSGCESCCVILCQ